MDYVKPAIGKRPLVRGEEARLGGAPDVVMVLELFHIWARGSDAGRLGMTVTVRPRETSPLTCGPERRIQSTACIGDPSAAHARQHRFALLRTSIPAWAMQRRASRVFDLQILHRPCRPKHRPMRAGVGRADLRV